MTKTQEALPVFFFSNSDRKNRRLINNLKKKKLIRKIGPRLYTSVAVKNEGLIVKQHWSDIISKLYPGSLISHRSALEFRPDENGVIFLTGKFKRKIAYAGLTLKFIQGHAALPDDPVFLSSLRCSSFHRALLENLKKTKTVLKKEKIEERLELYLAEKGEAGLNEIRDKAKKISVKLNMKSEFKKLENIIGSLLGTKKISSNNPVVIARSQNRPYDVNCLSRLEMLFAELKNYPFAKISDTGKGSQHFKNKAFFDSYFSNYIEGTIFEISEAEEIIFDRKIPQKRVEDAHDIKGTFDVLSDPNKMNSTPKDFDHFIKLIKKIHATIMQGHPGINPGQFKEKENRAGNTFFVRPEYVIGTLEKGMQYYFSLTPGVPRAIFLSFLISDVHPFNDGNGRLCRIMLNIELYSQKIPTAIIPTVYREDYILALKALTKRGRALPLIKMFLTSIRFSNLDFSNYSKTLKYLKEHNWFEEPNDAKILLH